MNDVKLMLVGDCGVGKSCIFTRFADNVYTNHEATTFNMFTLRTIQLDGKAVKLQIWDTPGQMRFRAMVTPMYRSADGIFLVYDITDEQSFVNVQHWMTSIQQHAREGVEKVLIGAKCDLDSARRVDPKRAQAFADRNSMYFFESSGKENVKITEPFALIARQIVSRLNTATVQSESGNIKHVHFIPGKNTANCECCNSRFVIYRWPHHCRECGRCVCSTCAPSTRTKNLVKHGYKTPQRVCLNCFEGKPPSIKYVLGATEDVYGEGLKFIQNDSDLKISDEKWTQGTTAHIHRGTYRRQRVAIKHYVAPVQGKVFGEEKKTSNTIECFKEIEILSAIGGQNPAGHCGIIEVVSSSATASYYQYLVTKLYPNGTLHDLLFDCSRRIVAPERRQLVGQFKSIPLRLEIAKQIASAIDFVHSKQHLHLDLKADSVLIDSFENKKGYMIRVFDFGTSLKLSSNGQVSQDMIRTIGPIGTATHMAPEVWQGQPYGTAADVYSFGVLLAELFADYSFGGGMEDEKQLPDETVFREYPSDLSTPTGLSHLSSLVCRKQSPLRPATPTNPELAQVKALMERCWDAVPESRPKTFKEISLELELLEANLAGLQGQPSQNTDPYQSILSQVDALQKRVCSSFHKPICSSLEDLKQMIEQQSHALQRLLQLDLEHTLSTCTFAQNLLPRELNESRPQALLDKTAAGLLRAAAIAQPVFANAMQALIHAPLTYDCLHVAPVKSEARLLEKMAELGEGREMAVLDMNRATILCCTEAEFALVCANIPIEFGQIVKMRNKFKVKWEQASEPPCLFYQLELKCPELNELLEEGKRWMVEVQITTPDIYRTKQRSHNFYELTRARVLPPFCAMCGRDPDGRLREKEDPKSEKGEPKSGEEEPKSEKEEPKS